jgi:hypothetical protein
MYARNQSRKQLTKFCSRGLVIGVSILGAAATQAMPIAFDGICRPNVAPGIVVAPGVVVGPGRCGGRGTHFVCNPYRCWHVCN